MKGRYNENHKVEETRFNYNRDVLVHRYMKICLKLSTKIYLIHNSITEKTEVSSGEKDKYIWMSST